MSHIPPWSPAELKVLAEQAITQGPDRWIGLPAKNLLEVLLLLEQATSPSGVAAPYSKGYSHV